MKLQQLRFFCAVVESRSVTAASERLHISQPALSAGLKALQDDLGSPLFDRSGGKQRIVPTQQALLFYEHAKDILDRCDVARASIAEGGQSPAAMRIGVLRTLASDDVATVLGYLMRSPSPVWKAREGTNAEVGKWLAQGRIDIAWTSIERPSETAQILWQEPFDVLVARHHRLAQRETICITDLVNENIILRTSCELRSGKLQSAGIKLRVVARASRDDLALKLVEQGTGVAIAPRSFAGGDIVAVPFADVDLSRSIGLRWRPGLSDSHVVSVREAISACGSEPDPKRQSATSNGSRHLVVSRRNA
ncbi:MULTISPECIES: LysR family transcriptional regulator [unclassified Xanthobacter]|uniref:LysR family transcriptional regulator n=1 Tax=unclassified Xanthobacter TaxID=2623496 RepID=UPI001F2DB1C1|nr:MULTISPECIES: LysR family transcriptional regulator [unclassified Xanthobacter]